METERYIKEERGKETREREKKIIVLINKKT
jgi:hypothetical protein